MPRTRPYSPLAGAALVLAAGMALAACSSGGSQEKRDYAVPSSLCGTAVSPAALEPLLPAGSKITSVKSGPSGFVRCRLVVDRQVAVTSIIDQRQSGTRLMNVAYSTYGMRSDKIKKETQNYIISESLAVGHVSCGELQKEGHELFTVIRKERGTVDATAMERTITDFTDAVSTSQQCTASHP
ncbi:hypothetical protein [Streptomyces sp. NPDC017673]|uniref:hypothetical protein n=1 Tax=unclassified Streptomyces TaxID=2593676 RepID=UPI0037ABB324